MPEVQLDHVAPSCNTFKSCLLPAKLSQNISFSIWRSSEALLFQLVCATSSPASPGRNPDSRALAQISHWFTDTWNFEKPCSNVLPSHLPVISAHYPLCLAAMYSYISPENTILTLNNYSNFEHYRAQHSDLVNWSYYHLVTSWKVAINRLFLRPLNVTATETSSHSLSNIQDLLNWPMRRKFTTSLLHCLNSPCCLSF